MPLFQYKAATHAGEVVEGRLEADSRAALVAHLQDMGLVPIRAEEVQAKTQPRKRFLGRWRRRIQAKEVTSFTLELATLLHAGVALDRALQILISTSGNPELRRVVQAVHDDVRAGALLSEALEARGKVFSAFYGNMVRAGESGGALTVTLEQLAESLAHTQALKESLVAKLIYPILLIILAGLSVMVLLTYVIPQFRDLFAQAGATLPLATRVVMTLGDLAVDYGWLLVALLSVGALYVDRQWRSPSTRVVWDGRILAMPLAGSLVQKLETARFTRALGTLSKNGVPLLAGVGIAREIIANRAFAERLQGLIPALEAGQGLARPMSESGVLPDLAVQLIHVGEESGQLDEMLVRVADIFEREVESAINRILALLEPALILGLGLLVGGIIMSILAAILSANELAF